MSKHNVANYQKRTRELQAHARALSNKELLDKALDSAIDLGVADFKAEVEQEYNIFSNELKLRLAEWLK